MVKPGYKQTEIGVIPEDWDIKSLQDIVVSPLSYGVNAPAVPYDSNLYRYIRITDITEDGHYSKEDEVSVNILDGEKYCLCKGDILLARTGASTGKTYLYRTQDGKLVYAGFLIRASVDVDNYNPFYVFAQFHTKRYQDWVSTMSIRSGQPGINGKEYSSYLLPIPKIGEQKQIASALSDIDALITNLEKLIAKKKAIKQGAMQELLTGNRRLPGFDGEWKQLRIGDVLSIGHGMSQHKVETPSGRYPILATGGIIGRSDTFLWNQPSVLIGRKGTIDKPQYMETPFWTIDTLFYTRIKEKVCAKFIYYVFCMVNWYDYNEASGVPSLSAKTIESIEIHMPCYEEQNAIANLLTDMDVEIEEHIKKLIKYQNIKCGMMSELLTGRIRLV